MNYTILKNKALSFTSYTLASLLVLALVMAPAHSSEWGSDAAGTTGADFLNLPVGAKAIGMGGAYTAVAEGTEALYWNPAGLVQINSVSATVMASKYIADVDYQYLAYAHRLTPYTVIAGSVLLNDIGSMDGYDVNATPLGSFNPKNQVYTLGVSQAILELSEYDIDISMGLSGKYMHSKLTESASGWAVDFGIMAFHYNSFMPYRLGFVVQNLGRGLKFDVDRDPLPITFKAGAAANVLKDLVISADFIVPKSAGVYATFGAEYAFEPGEDMNFFIRAGLNTQQMGIDGGLAGAYFGAGFSFQYFSLDYAFSPMGDLGTTHRFSLSFDFPMWKPVFKREERSIFGGENLF